jgi:hypothetical protein
MLQTLKISNKNLAFVLRMYMSGVGVEVKAGETKYMALSRDQNAKQIYNIKIDNSSFEKWNSSNIGEKT